MFMLRIISSIAAIVLMNFELCFCACTRAEYEIHGECCPMCAPGNHVYWHCTIDTSTTCSPCPESTYTDEPNGLMKCFPCSVCDAVKSLKVKKACTRTADTICEPQEGFYCTDQNKQSCTLALKHSKCNPGQYIKHKGTAFTDTLCANCTDDTYSDGSLLSCQPHTICETDGLTKIKPGTTSTDVECGKSSPVSVIVTTVLFVAAFIISLICFFFKRRRQHTNKRHQGKQESSEGSREQDGLTATGGRENVAPHTCRLQDQTGLNTNNLEIASVSNLLTNNASCTQEIGRAHV